MIIACVGPSGSGKTTVINHLKHWEYFKERKISIWKEDDFKIIKLLKLILGDNIFSQYKEQKFFNNKPNSLKSIIFSKVVFFSYPLVIYLEFLWIYFLYTIIWRGRLLLCDRYIYDYLVTFEEMLGIRSPIVKYLIFKFPKPYLTFYLCIDKSISLARNKDNIKGKITVSSSLHESVIKKYTAIATQLGILSIGSGDRISSTIDEIKYYIQAKEKLASIRSISISGIDGAGKSTISKNLNDLCLKLGIKSCTVQFFHLPILHKILTRIGFKYQNIINSSGIQRKRSFWWGIVNFLDANIQYTYFRVINLHSLIVFDRYFYDYLVSFKYREVPYLKMFSNTIPRTDRSFIFIINPDEAYERGSENLTNDYFQSMNILYLELALQQSIKIIDVNNKNSKEIVDEIIDSI